jgi:hypothetical protein
MGPTHSREGRMFNFMMHRLIINDPKYIMEQAFKQWSQKTMVSKMKSKYIFIETTNFVENQLYFNVQYFHFVLYDKKYGDSFYICNNKTLEKEINHSLCHDPTRGYKMYKVIKKNRWMTIKCLVLILGLHSKAVITANHPLRKLSRNEFQLEVCDDVL